MEKLTFYHYTRFIDEVKKHRKLLAGSYPKTSVYDFVLDFCPEILLDKKEIQKLEKYKIKNKKLINKYRNEWKEDKNDLSAYRNLKLIYKNKILQDFFKNKWYILSFSKLLEKGWIKDIKNNKYSKASAVFLKTGNQYTKFKITKSQFEKSFVVEQKYWKYWRVGYTNNLMSKKFGRNWWQKYLRYDKLFYNEFKELDKKGREFMNSFVKNTFGKCYLSIKRLRNYKEGEFEVPEFWIYGDIPISKCKFGEVNFKLFKEKTGYSKKDLEKRGIKKCDYIERKKQTCLNDF